MALKIIGSAREPFWWNQDNQWLIISLSLHRQSGWKSLCLCLCNLTNIIDIYARPIREKDSSIDRVCETACQQIFAEIISATDHQNFLHPPLTDQPHKLVHNLKKLKEGLNCIYSMCKFRLNCTYPSHCGYHHSWNEAFSKPMGLTM